MSRRLPRVDRAPAAVVVLAIGAVGVLALLALLVPLPRFFLDELVYMEAAVSLAEGHGLRFRDEGWGYGVLYPTLLAGFVRVTGSQETTYELAKLGNVACFVAATAPVYALARQVLRAWPSVVVVALTLAIPSTVYTSVVMTESLAFLASSTALLAIVVAVRSTRVGTHALAVAAILVAASVRTQFLALIPAYLAALALAVWVSPGLRERLRARPVALVPALVVLVAGLVRLAVVVARGEGASEPLGSYGVLARSYDPVDLTVSFVRQVGDLTLYLAVVPVVVAPAVVGLWLARARRGGDREAAILSTLLAVTLSTLAVVAAFASTEFAVGLLHDRNFFYVVPLWLIVLVAWVSNGMPRSPHSIALGAAIALTGLAALPYDWLARNLWAAQFEATATELPGQVAQVVPDGALPAVVLVAGAAVAVAVFVTPRNTGWLVVGAVGLGLLANSAIAWRSAFPEDRSRGVAGRGTREWVDERLPSSENATLLFVVRRCEGPYERNAALQTLFFNRRVEASLAVGREGVAEPVQATVLSDGRIVTDARRPTPDRFVVAQPGVALVGTRVATGTRANLVLWRIVPPLRGARATSAETLGGC